MDCSVYYKINKCVITIFDSFAYYKLRQRVITIYDSAVITILDNCYYNLQQVLQFTTLLQLTRENMMLAALPIACVQTPPPPLSENRRRAPSPIFTEGRGVCTQATFPIHLLISLFPVNYFELPISRTFSLEG